MLTAATFASGIAFGGPGAANAADIGFHPTSLTVAPPARVATLTLENPSDDVVRVQVRGYRWRESDTGVFQLDPTSEIIVFPQLATIPPLSSQQVRAAVVTTTASTTVPFRSTSR